MKISHFAYPEVLIIGSLILGIFLVFLYISKKKSNFGNMPLLQKIYGYQSIGYYVYIFSLISVSLLFITLLAKPLQSQNLESIEKNGVDIQIVLDLSYSMIATDIKPNRLEVAKKVFQNFIASRTTDRVGLILFAGKTFQSVPLSYDYIFLQDFINRLEIDTINQTQARMQGTAIGDGLVLASKILTQDESNREKIIILITDGEANRGISPEIALKLLKEQNIKIYSIGVGKNQETTVLVPSPFGLQRTIIGGLDEEILQILARETNGKYFRADSPESFQNIIDTISELEQKPLETKILTKQRERYDEIFFILLVFFIIIHGIFFIKKIRL